MKRRPKAWTIALLLAAAGAAAGPPPPVVPGYVLAFPRDRGSHPAFLTEWWYATGWLRTRAGEDLGFQITFFRSRQPEADANPSAFAPRQIVIAHAALADPAFGRLRHDQRIAREGFGLAGAQTNDTRVWIDDWRLERDAAGYALQASSESFSLRLALVPTQPPMLNGEAGYSRKGAAPLAASYYYSEPQLRVRGEIGRDGRRDAVTGEAWLDHEWSSEPLEPGAVGWDWVGLNIAGGGALMAFRIRDGRGGVRHAGGTLRTPAGTTRALAPTEIVFTPLRHWRSPRTGIDYPVEWQLQAGTFDARLEPLMDDQESDSRATTGAIYWEGAVRARAAGRVIARGYLELTGYGEPLSLR